MTLFPTPKIIKLIVFAIVLCFHLACQKDSDLFADMSYAEQQAAVDKKDRTQDETATPEEEEPQAVEAEAPAPLPQADQTIALHTLKAFPSAQGHAADQITGGKGGKIFYVDDLGNNSNGSYDPVTDTHTGSFKYALQHPDPGYVIFRTAGVITSNSVNDYLISSPNAGNKTIMGGTAPYPGIVFYGHQFRLSNGRGNWIVRGMTFLGGTGLEAGKYDAFQGQDISSVIISDNTMGWASDEATSFDDADKIIVQRNAFIEGHPDHNTGSLFATDTYTSGQRKLTMHNNGYFHISHRFPNVRGLESDQVDVINQFAYNMKGRLESHKFQMNLNDINNYYKKGPRSASSPKKKWNADDEGSPLWNGIPRIYCAGNILTGVMDDPGSDNSTMWDQHISSKGYISGDPLPIDFFTTSMHPVGLDIKIKSASEAYNYNIVGKNIGARFYTDSNGKRVKYIHKFVEGYFNDAVSGRDNSFLDDQTRFLLPSLPAAAAPYVDLDHDGMPDEWEKQHGLQVGVADHEGIMSTWVIDGVEFINSAGYSNIQMFDDYVHGGFLILKDGGK